MELHMELSCQSLKTRGNGGNREAALNVRDIGCVLLFPVGFHPQIRCQRGLVQFSP